MEKNKSFKLKPSGAKAFKKKRLYDQTSWFDHSRKFLQLNPKCYACGNVARVVDHVVSAKGDEEKFWCETNMIPMCKPCHDYVTGKYDKHIVAKTEEKMKWIANKRTQTETTVRVKPLKVEK